MKIEFVWSDLGALPAAARLIRSTVFMDEQGFVDEFDDIDAHSWHVLLLMDGLPCGTARLFWENGVPHMMRLGRLALYKNARGGGYGRTLLSECFRMAQSLGASRIVLDAQKRAKGFYVSCGMTVIGDEFIEEDYPHYRMECDLTERGA